MGSVIYAIQWTGGYLKSAATTPIEISVIMLIYCNIYLCFSLMSTMFYSLFSFLVEMFLPITTKNATRWKGNDIYNDKCDRGMNHEGIIETWQNINAK